MTGKAPLSRVASCLAALRLAPLSKVALCLAPLLTLSSACPGSTGLRPDGVKKGAHAQGDPAGPHAAMLKDPIVRGAPPDYLRGIKALTKRPADFLGALEAFEKALQGKPGHREARLNAAFCLLRLGRLAHAERLYREAASPKDREALLGLVDVLLRRDRASEALKPIGAYLEKHPKDLQILSLAAEAERRAGSPDRALGRIQQALTIDRRDAEAHVQFGMLFLLRKDARTALMIFGRGLEHRPKHPRLQLGRGLAWLAQGEMGRAVMDFEKAVKADGSLVTGRLLLGKVYLENLDFDGALRHFQAVLTDWPRHSEAMLGLARAHFGKKQFPEALSGYKAVVAEHGALPQALFQIARIYQEHLDQARQALIYYRKFVQAQPDLKKDDPVFATIRMLESIKATSPRKPAEKDGPARDPDGGGK